VSEHDPRDDYDDEPWRGRLTAEQLVKPPADWLWSCGMFQLGVSLLVLLLFIGGLFESMSEGRRIRPAEIRAGAITIPVALVGIGIATVVLFGSGGMRRLRRRPWAVAAAVLTLLSLPCVFAVPFAGPIGVWALSVLCRRDVRAWFAAVARDTMKPAPAGPTDARAP